MQGVLVGDEGGNRETLKLYNQFVIDVPRVDMFVDNELYEGDSTSLFMTLWSIFGKDTSQAKRRSLSGKLLKTLKKIVISNISDSSASSDEDSNEKVTKSLSFCTQTVLAEFYQKASDRFCNSADDSDMLHLVDGGRQLVHIRTKESPRTIEVRKPFKIVDFSRSDETTTSDPMVVRLLELILRYDTDADVAQETWRERGPEGEAGWEFL